MTDRFTGVQVTFNRDIREDDLEEIMKLLRCLKFVADVRPIGVEHYSGEMLRERASLTKELEKLADKVRMGKLGKSEE